MDEVLHANIFFLISSIATVVFCILVSIILYHVLKLVRCARRILERVEAGSEQIAEDLTTVRSYIAQGGMLGRMLSFFMPSSRSRKRSRRYDVEVDEL